MITTAAWIIICYYPFLLAAVFLATLVVVRRPDKGEFILRALLALLIAVVLAHLNRIFGWWQGDLRFFSGHMTFCLGMAISLGMLYRWTLAITLPMLVPLGIGLVWFHCHTVLAVVAAVPICVAIYALVYRLWPMPSASRSL